MTFDHADGQGNANVETALQAIETAQAGDVILLHGCCHNPTGMDYSEDDWKRLAAQLAQSGVLPILDIAYQGLGDGLDEDAQGIRTVLAAVPEALIAYSCDKNFGMYRDRVGALYAMAQNPASLPPILSNLNSLARANWSMPPDHGGAAVRIILRDEDMTKLWQDELQTMRGRMRRVRDRLAEAGMAGSVDLRNLAKQNGMFSMLPLSADQIQRLRDDHAIYMAGSGRINVAGLHIGNTAKFIAALTDVTGGT